MARRSHYKHARAVDPSGGTRVCVCASVCVWTENVTFLATELCNQVVEDPIHPHKSKNLIIHSGPQHSAHTLPGVANSNLKTKP